MATRKKKVAASRENFESMSKEDLLEYIQGNIEQGVKINFSGKNTARKIARKVQPRSSRELHKLGVGSNEKRSKNLIIDGENLQAMVTLYKERGMIDLIVTDPPYNTGTDFRYNDKWDEDPNDPDLGDLVSADDGAKHTKWMKFMWPRLSMMKDMLKPSGVLAICIDHRELFHLGSMLDELFDGNRLAIINWEKSYATKSDNTHISTATEYVLVYSKNPDLTVTGLLPRTKSMDARYKSPDGDLRIWKADNPAAPGDKTHPGMVYAIQSPFTGELLYPAKGSHWKNNRADIKVWLEGWGSEYINKELNDGNAQSIVLKNGQSKEGLKKAKEEAEKVLKRGTWPRIFFGMNGKGRPQFKRYLEDVKKGQVPTTYWVDDDYEAPLELGSISWDHEQSGHSQEGVLELDSIVGKGHGFQTVKPLRLISKIIQIWCPPDGLVMDPFAGSGTTGHAVLALNHMAGTERNFILVEKGRPEKGDPYAQSLTQDRLARAITGKWANGKGKPIDAGFRFVQLKERVDAKALLSMERDEMTDTVIASNFELSNKGNCLVTITDHTNKYLVAKNADNEGIFLVWEGAKKTPVFDARVYEEVVKEAIKAGLRPRYHIYARFIYTNPMMSFFIKFQIRY